MSETVVSKSRFPILHSVFVVPTLLEVGVNANNLTSVILVKDPKEILRLKGGRGAKMAKRWAPLLVYNAMNSPSDSDSDDLVFALGQAEEVLEKCGSNSWFSAFREAGQAGVPPSVWIKHMPEAKKRLLHSQERQWKDAAHRFESILTRWILSDPIRSKALIDTQTDEKEGQELVSLRKMARFKPSV